MEIPPEPARLRQRKLARGFLILVSSLFIVLLGMIAFVPELLHTPLFGSSMTLGLPVAFLFGLIIFLVMTYYVLAQKKG